MCLNKCGRNDNTAALDEEGYAEGSPCFWLYESCIGEKQASAEKEGD